MFIFEIVANIYEKEMYTEIKERKKIKIISLYKVLANISEKGITFEIKVRKSEKRKL